ncbi:MAG TPA: F0F1 ATP synthase subunit delta [Steroidobacteraceae bacterium]|nr:F0F1 ATP synthase subunit delta [Steroidobacteraceae bacterium]
MAELITIARPYARAAFEAASAARSLAGWSAWLERAAAAVRDPQLEPLLGNPRVPTGELVQLLLAVAQPPAKARTGKAGEAGGREREREELHNFLALLAHNRRLTLLPEIAAQYARLRADAERVIDVQVRSARELTSEQAAALSAALERRLGRSVRMQVTIEAALLGGAVVHYGDYVVDGSLRGRLERLAASVAGV